MIHSPRRARRGFTLIELLTVIAIIVVLIGILLPVVRAVRIASYNTSSQSLIANLTSAIEHYRSDFNAYPGIASNNDLATGNAPNYANMTMTECMVVSLVGGWDFVNVGTGALNPSSIGLGPMSHNPIASARRRYATYIDVSEGKNFPTRNASNAFDPWGPTASPATSGDTAAPEFMDAFPDPLPILYMRANVGVLSGTGGTTPWGTDNTHQYNIKQLIGSGPQTGQGSGIYKRPASSNGSFKGDFLMNIANDTDDFPDWNTYISDPNTVATNPQPRQKDGFWLIAAGADRRYGTRDDQSNFGGFR